ncbi:MAG: HAD family hydrolase [Chloroflexi bacterium]|nr:HAD family hydrolase [Chloroflexota bacterium]
MPNLPLTRFDPTILQAIIFDMDDTLYPECDFVLSGFHAVADWSVVHLGIPAEAGYTELKRLFNAGVRGDTFNQWLYHFGIAADKEIIPQLISVYRDHEPNIMPFPTVPALLKTLHARYKLGLLSDGYLEVQQRKFKALNIAAYLDAVVFSDEWGREAWKPSTKPFTAVLERLGVKASQAVYIADNPKKDFLGANQIGMQTIWLKRAQGEYAGFTPPTFEHVPQITISSWTELQGLLPVTAVGIPAKPLKKTRTRKR